jgi:aspartate ammonia-lyase
VKSGRSIRDLVLERGLLDEARLNDILSVDAMTRGGITGEQGQAGPGRAGQAGRAGKAGRE